jgi:hypothetical protein
MSSFLTVDPAPPDGTPLSAVSTQTILPPSPPPPPVSGEQPSALTVTNGPNLGFSAAAAGDLNDDGMADFLGGAPGYDVGGVIEAGVALVALGSSEETLRQEPDIIYTGVAEGDRAGVAVVGNFDFNGDGAEDILIGAEQIKRTGDPEVEMGNGKVYLIYFNPAEYDFNSSGVPDYEPGTCDVVTTEVCHDDAECVAAGAGTTCSEPGAPVFVSLAEVGVSISGAVFTGVALGDQAGFALAAGGQLGMASTASRDDIVIGAPGTDGDNGAAYVIFSDGTTLTGSHSLADTGTGALPGAIYQGSSMERLGSAVALPGDITLPDGDGPNIALGAPDLELTEPGRVYIAAAGDLGSVTILATSITTHIDGDQAGEQLGFSVAGGGDNRVNGEPDLLIGSPFYDVIDTVTLTDAGRVAQTIGLLPTGQIDVARIGDANHGSPIDGVIWEGTQDLGSLGWSVARLGDVTNNGLEDVGLGAPFVNTSLGAVGAVYLIEGTTAILTLVAPIDVSQVGQSTAGTLFVGDQSDENAGVVTSRVGNIDSDTENTNDFMVGAPGWNLDDGTIHQVLDSNLPPPGRCGPLGCTIVHLPTGAQLMVDPGALAGTTDFEVIGLPDAVRHTPSCAPTDLPGKTMVGVADFNDENFGDFSSLPPTIDIPTRTEVEYQLTNGEALDLYFCDPSILWIPQSPGHTGQVKDNDYIFGRKAVMATGVNSLHLWAAFFPDLDGDDVRTSCDCDDANGDLWEPPGDPRSLMLSTDAVSGATILQWQEPDLPGATSGVLPYDVVRSDVADFSSETVIEAGGTDTSATDVDEPLLGAVFYYRIRSVDLCPPSPPMCR